MKNPRVNSSTSWEMSSACVNGAATTAIRPPLGVSGNFTLVRNGTVLEVRHLWSDYAVFVIERL